MHASADLDNMFGIQNPPRSLALGLRSNDDIEPLQALPIGQVVSLIPSTFSKIFLANSHDDIIRQHPRLSVPVKKTANSEDLQQW